MNDVYCPKSLYFRTSFFLIAFKHELNCTRRTLSFKNSIDRRKHLIIHGLVVHKPLTLTKSCRNYVYSGYNTINFGKLQDRPYSQLWHLVREHEKPKKLKLEFLLWYLFCIYVCVCWWLCVYVCVCVCVCVSVFIRVYVLTYLCVLPCLYLCVYWCVYVLAYVCEFLCLCMLAYVCVLWCMCVCVCVPGYVRAYVLMYVCMCVCLVQIMYIRYIYFV